MPNVRGLLDMRELQFSKGKSTIGEVQLQMSEMLNKIGSLLLSRQTTSPSAVVSDLEIPGGTWEGRDFGVRGPHYWESPLSKAEIAHGIRNNLFI